MSREALDRWCERSIFALVLAILVLGPLAFGAVPPPAFLTIQTLTLGVMLLWGARLWLQPRPQLLWPPITWVVIAFAVYAIARYLTADIEYVARLELIRVLVYAFLFLAILNNLHRQEATYAVSCTLVFLAMAISFYAVYQFLTGSERIWHIVNKAYPHRGTGTYICPNHLGGFLEMVLPLGLAYTLTSRLKPVVKVFLGYASLAILAGIAVTGSRGSWVATALSLLLFFGVLFFRRSHRLASLALLVIIVVTGLFFLSRSFELQARFRQLGVPKKVENDTRFALWQSALQVWGEDLWWGVGPAHYDYRFSQYRPEAIQKRPFRVHNDFLNTLADWGLVGAGQVAAAWALLGLGVWKTRPFVRAASSDLGGRQNSNKFAFLLGASTGLFAILVHSACDFNMHIPANAILAITMMALVSSQLRFATEQYWIRLGVWRKAVGSAILLAGIVYLGRQGWRQAAEYAPLQQAAAAPHFSPAAVACLKRAFAVEPMNPQTAWDIGEGLRIQSSEGGRNYRELAEQGLDWFERSIKLNRWSGSGYLGCGWCLDWLERWAESGPYFDRAAELDPNNYYTVAYVGLHYVQLQDYAAAKPWFERSVRLEWEKNPIARNYLEIIQSRLLEAATNETNAKLDAPPR